MCAHVLVWKASALRRWIISRGLRQEGAVSILEKLKAASFWLSAGENEEIPASLGGEIPFR